MEYTSENKTENMEEKQQEIYDGAKCAKETDAQAISVEVKNADKTDAQEAKADAGCCKEADAADTECACCKTKHRDGKEYRDLMNRLKRIEGQIRGIQGMLSDERYCVDILTQVTAVQSALNSFNKVLLSNHIKSCVVQDIQDGNAEAVDELCATIQKLMK